MGKSDIALVSKEARRWLAAIPVSIVTCYAIFFAVFLFRVGPKDHDQFLVFHELQYWNAALFGIAKQWTPLMCTGLSLAGEPQVPFMSLSMLLTYLVGPLLGLKLATLIYFLAGWFGAFLYSGLWMQLRAQRVLAASLFIGNGFFICRLGYGHIDFMPFLLLPAILWAMHRIIDWTQAGGIAALGRFASAILLLGASLSLTIDGSPVAIMHLLFWVVLYALVLSYTVRSAAPLLLLAGSLTIVVFLDAGYLWPMIEAQADFPRRTADSFTSFFSLIWFALLPVTGKVLPANGNGHELSVFIGPIIAYLLWRYRPVLTTNLPKSMCRPLLIVSVVSIIFGMGSLAPLHIPVWLSPFDLLRPLPGFRSMGVTGRYWGFLALPLSLLGAAALWRFAAEFQNTTKFRFAVAGALVLQLGFQNGVVLTHWLYTRGYAPVEFRDAFRNGPQEIEYTIAGDETMQGALITPARAVLDCYNEDDFIHAQGTPGKSLVQAVLRGGQRLKEQPLIQAAFASWSHIVLRFISSPYSPSSAQAGKPGTTGQERVQLVLNQAFHPLWRASGCDTSKSVAGNLTLDCPRSRLESGNIDLTFQNPLSSHAAHVSLIAWRLWLLAASFLVATLFARRCVKVRNTAVNLPQS